MSMPPPGGYGPPGRVRFGRVRETAAELSRAGHPDDHLLLPALRHRVDRLAAQVNSRYSGGDYAGAVDASNKARMWAWLSFGTGLAIALVWIIAVAGIVSD